MRSRYPRLRPIVGVCCGGCPGRKICLFLICPTKGRGQDRNATHFSQQPRFPRRVPGGADRLESRRGVSSFYDKGSLSADPLNGLGKAVSTVSQHHCCCQDKPQWINGLWKNRASVLSEEERSIEQSRPGGPTSRGSLVGSHPSASHRTGRAPHESLWPLPPDPHGPHNLDAAFVLSCPLAVWVILECHGNESEDDVLAFEGSVAGEDVGDSPQ